jgi:hypothetical protein
MMAQRGMTAPFLDALGADGPAADRAGKMDLYGRFVGSWDLDVSQFSDDGRERRRAGEWHFGWALEGRAVQDVWIVPPRGEWRRGDAAANVNSYGTTLRVYDPDIDAWRIQWTDPVTRNFLQMIGRAEGADIVQLGTRLDGQLMRWSFLEITPDSFRWRGEISADDGASWRVNTEFTATRMPLFFAHDLRANALRLSRGKTGSHFSGSCSSVIFLTDWLAARS